MNKNGQALIAKNIVLDQFSVDWDHQLLISNINVDNPDQSFLENVIFY